MHKQPLRIQAGPALRSALDAPGLSPATDSQTQLRTLRSGLGAAQGEMDEAPGPLWVHSRQMPPWGRPQAPLMPSGVL
ncbi:unnamed protein product [Rangifer tarandus platyrhynchus]|uniref:Uncharacterized protein n=1 Tax=Rangifer tarandus platyrhynchus TaxID=3082113 RepID=A0AC59ZYW2_RANTA